MKTLVVFTYAPAGLGHIRVANALNAGLPKDKDLDSTVFAPADTSTQSIHRFTSLNVPARHVMEFFQRGKAEILFNKFYVRYLKRQANKLVGEFVQLIKSQKNQPEKIVIIATHFGLAYQLGSIKKELEELTQTKIYIAVQVTDDSPQTIWYVDSADLIVCPSHKTKETLQTYAKKADLKRVDMVVVPYPVDPDFAKALSEEKLTNRVHQYDPTKETPIHIVIPVSGAAVGMDFFLHVMHWLHLKSDRFVFHVVCRKAPFTVGFLHKVKHRKYAKLYVSSDYREIIDIYEKVYLDNVISAEITKPSEQAFKALVHNNAIAGAFLLLAEPVGRQEHDNIDFLERHNFLAYDSSHLRGCILPHGSKASAELIWNLYNSGKLLSAYQKFRPVSRNEETGDNGVDMFWHTVCKLCG